MKLKDPVSKIPLIGPKYEKILQRLEINTNSDLLNYFPSSYFDSSKISPISELSREEKKTFKATITKFETKRTRKKGFSIQQANAEDDKDAIELIWFNQPFLKNSIKEGETYILSGKLNPKQFKAQIIAPDFELEKEEQTHVGRIIPIYPLTEGLSNKWLRSKTKWLIDKLEFIEDLSDNLDKRIREKYNLTGLEDALINIHFPKNEKTLEKARFRLGFEELLQIQVRIIKNKRKLKKQKAPQIDPKPELLEKFEQLIEFELTKDQKQAIEEVAEDLQEDKPMRRLLSGDVGSGKTMIALAASILTVKSGYQVCILVPTTVLAKQHYDTFSKYLKTFDISVSLVSSENKSSEKVDVVIGTHAILFQKDELFSKLALVVIDEQHKFGVKQREDLEKFISTNDKEKSLHVLNMTATPIPRTLALSIFADIEISQIKTKPKERKITQTHLVPEGKRNSAYKWIEKMAKKGVQIFWITPLIEESDKLEAKSVQEMEKELEKNLPSLNIKSIHGRLKPTEKQETLKKFRNFEANKIHILVSTSVIEVGIDIPNANIIVIEGAERFGLAQLHQLRGRVGRSAQESWCFLFTTQSPSETQHKRLEFFAQEKDGFKIAEFDLRQRGPGEVYGTRQSGIPNLKIANIFDLDLVKQTNQAANFLLDQKPS